MKGDRKITLVKLREGRGMTQKDLAKLLHCTQGTVSLLEKGKRNPTYDKACMIASIFDVPVERIQFASK